MEFQNERTSAFFRIREALEAGRLQLPPDDLLTDELTSLRYGDTPVGRVALEPKADLVARLNRSCDRADALSMSLAVEGSHAPLGAMTMRAAW